MELKPCPFCGGEAEYYGEEDMVRVKCSICGANTSGWWDEPEEAAEDWNRRTPDIDIPVDHLQEICEAEREGRVVVLPLKEFLEKSGDVVYLIDDGEIIEVIHCGAQISPEGEIYVIVAADDKIFPYREPNAEFDMEPSDWCINTKTLEPSDFGKIVFFTVEEAEAALKEVEKE